MDTSRVLLVDDEEDIRTVAAFALETIGGFKVEAASSGNEAIRKARKGSYDVILMDFNMPGMDGVQTVWSLGEAGVHIPVIFVTANLHPTNLVRYAEAGAIGVIPKPFDPMELANQVQQILTERGTNRYQTCDSDACQNGVTRV